VAIQNWLKSDFKDKLRFNIEADKLALLIILILALALRLIFFNGLNWDDDPDYVWRAYQVKSGQAFIFNDNNGFRIGTFYPAALMYVIFGINNFACGAYALVISLLSISAIFSLGQLLFNKTTGLAAALLLAFYPLDVELASRLMPDGLLSGFSLFAIYFLMKGDKKNREDNAPRLVSKGCYVLSGLLLAWCTLVNMSSFVLIILLFIYSILSIFYFKDKLIT
jgi:4-amino-4-deoxy-L-arabinose transferase-like glycosyltransferase